MLTRLQKELLEYPTTPNTAEEWSGLLAIVSKQTVLANAHKRGATLTSKIHAMSSLPIHLQSNLPFLKTFKINLVQTLHEKSTADDVPFLDFSMGVHSNDILPLLNEIFEGEIPKIIGHMASSFLRIKIIGYKNAEYRGEDFSFTIGETHDVEIPSVSWFKNTKEVYDNAEELMQKSWILKQICGLEKLLIFCGVYPSRMDFSRYEDWNCYPFEGLLGNEKWPVFEGISTMQKLLRYRNEWKALASCLEDHGNQPRWPWELIEYVANDMNEVDYEVDWKKANQRFDWWNRLFKNSIDEIWEAIENREDQCGIPAAKRRRIV